jgi:hypothetical protein
MQPDMFAKEAALPIAADQAAEKPESVVQAEAALLPVLAAAPGLPLQEEAAAAATLPQGDQRWSVEMVAHQVKVAGLLARLQQVVEGAWRDICRAAGCRDEASKSSIQSLASSSKGELMPWQYYALGRLRIAQSGDL